VEDLSMEEKKLYSFYGHIHCADVAGIVRATNKKEAKQILREVYDDYNLWEDKTLEEVKFDNDVCEIYYG
jgi:lysine/ornithine N-monooxygenase